MPLSGEAIRLMNYIDDVAVTLRRVLATIPSLTPEERARVAQHFIETRPNAQDIAQALAPRYSACLSQSPSSEQGRSAAGWLSEPLAPGSASCSKP